MKNMYEEAIFPHQSIKKPGENITLRNKEKKKSQLKDRESICGQVICQVCGRSIAPDLCRWDDNEGEGPYCQDCYAERGSCGCSD
jgi:hypothetical protein